MDRERDERVNRHLAELRALLTENPALAGRTREMLAGELPCPDLEEDDMTERELQSVRLPADLMERAEALVPAMEKDPELSTFGRVTKSAVVRVALLRGLLSLEQQYGQAPSAKKRRSK